MEEISSKPYLIRALHEWCTDNGYTPHILVNASDDVRVPRAHVRDGQIILNISTLATQHLALDNEQITFAARFGGVLEHIYVPISAVMAIYARETGAGMGFETMQVATQPQNAETTGKSLEAVVTQPSTDPVPQPLAHSVPVKPDDTPPGPPQRPKLTLVK